MCLFVFSRCVLAQQVISAGGFMALFARSFCDFAMIKLSRDRIASQCVKSISHGKCETNSSWAVHERSG